MDGKTDSHTILSEHCNIEYDKAGELIVISSLAAVQIAMEEYHQHRQVEEVQERFNKAMSYYNNETYMNGETKRAVVNAIKLAAGIEGKEEKE